MFILKDIVDLADQPTLVMTAENVRNLVQSANIYLPIGTLIWCNSQGEVHREGDKPAIITPHKTMKGYHKGILHREGGLPAIMWSDMVSEWYHHGVRYR